MKPAIKEIVPALSAICPACLAKIRLTSSGVNVTSFILSRSKKEKEEGLFLSEVMHQTHFQRIRIHIFFIEIVNN